MLLAALAYVLIERRRPIALRGSELAGAQIDTLGIRLLKLAAVLARNTRRIRLCFASNWHSAPIFAHAMRMLPSPWQFIQRLARACTRRQPATQAAVGIEVKGKRSAQCAMPNFLPASRRSVHSV